MRSSKSKTKKAAEMKIYNAVHREEKSAKYKAHYKAHWEEEKSRSRAYYASHWKESKSYSLKRNYGLSVIEFDIMFSNQSGMCAICGTTEWGSHGVCVDHSHITGKVRGLVCLKCNTALGMIGDDPKVAQALVNYLKRNGK